MAATSLLYVVKFSKIDSIELDASISETHSSTVDVTEHPVESGFNVSDHARPAPESIQIEAFVSNTPFSIDSPHAGDYTSPVGITYGWQSLSRGEPDRADIAYSALRDLKDLGAIITVVTALRTYEDMIITSLTVPRDADTGNGLRFSISLKQVRVVDAQTAVVPKGEDKVKKKVDLNKKATEKTELPKSVGIQLVDAISSVFE